MFEAVIPCSPRMRPNVSAGVPVSGWQKGSFRDRSIVSRTSSAPLTSTGRRARRSLKSAPSSITRLVTRTIRCAMTTSTDPNCLVIQSRISAGGSRRPTVDETARLEPRRHQEEVGPRVDPLRECAIEAQREREPSFVLRGEVAPFLLVGRVARSKDDELPALFEKPRGHGREKVDALLLHESADDAEDGRRGVALEAGLLLERGLVDRLPALIVGFIRRRDVRVLRQDEELRVYAVGDAPELRLSLPKETCEPLSEFRGEDLFRVALAHRRHDVRRRDRARHQVGLATIFDRQTRSRKPDELHNGGAGPSLVREVVDREHGGGFPRLTGRRGEWAD